MRRTLLVLIAALTLVATPAFAQTGWFVGANFGATHYSPDTGDGVTTIGWGDGTSYAGLWQPGLRIGHTIGSGQDELYTDTALQYLTFTGGSFTALQLSGNYQHDFSKPKTPEAYINAGAGIMSLGATHTPTTNLAIFGIGLGYGNPFADGHGRFRIEVRYDHQGEDKDLGLSAANLYTLRFGFDVME
jgi:hypothetical protein